MRDSPDSSAAADPPHDQTVFVHPQDSGAGARELKAPVRFLVPAEAPELAQRVGAEPVTVGRLALNALRLDDPTVSGRHCVVQERLGLLWVEDVGSTNGTFVNGIRLTRERRLTRGDIVRVGETDLRFEA
jgi:pSer/pThr/pTyr-binding forkhead associated (FHA) protein